MQTQIDRLLKYLKKNRRIEPMSAWTELGIYRLAARIHELRNKGFHITSSKLEVPNRYGEKCTVAQYHYKGTFKK